MDINTEFDLTHINTIEEALALYILLFGVAQLRKPTTEPEAAYGQAVADKFGLKTPAGIRSQYAAFFAFDNIMRLQGRGFWGE